MRTTVAAIDFGTNKIVTLVAENSGNQRCDISGAGIAPYDGFSGDQWNSPQQLNDAIKSSVQEAEAQAHYKIREINVGVPGEFSRVYAIPAKVELQGADPKVSMKHIETVFANAQQELERLHGVIIHRSPAWFMVDDGKKTLEPMNMKGRELKALVSFVVADQFFLDEMSGRLREMGISVSGFFSTITGEAMLYLPEEDRDRTSVLIDMGYLNTDVMIVEGDAIIYHHTVPLGGGHIAADVSEGLHIPLAAAEQIKRSYVYGMATLQQSYDIDQGEDGKPATFTHSQVEEILEPRVDEIGEEIKKAIDDSGVRLGNWSNIYLTGGGLSLNRGGRDYLAGKLEKPVRETPKRTVKLNSPIYASALGLIDLVIDTMENQKVDPTGPLGGVKSFFRALLNG